MQDTNEITRDELIQWFLNEKNQLNHKITDLKWEQFSEKEFTDVQVIINLNGQHIGRGTSANPLDALSIAICESIERYICAFNNIGTNGVAVHLSTISASQNAVNELIERHSVFYHLKNNIPFKNVSYLPSYLNLIASEVHCEYFQATSFNHIKTYIIRGKILNRPGYIYSTCNHLCGHEELKFFRKYIGLKEHNFETDNFVQQNCLNNQEYAFSDVFGKSINIIEESKILLIQSLEIASNIRFPVKCYQAKSPDAIDLTNDVKHFIG